MRKALKMTAAVLFVVALLIIVVTRLGVKSKNATLIYGGKKSASIRLFHGAGEPFGYDLLIYLPESGEDQPYVVENNSLFVCDEKTFLNMKLIAFGRHNFERCRMLASDRIFIRNLSVEFVSKKGVPVMVYWQSPPR
ncbi:MAG TPA: hypothetical protein VM056_06230 [Terriglobales bacterium]|nr:hypothetical protein [Terriglobales bacterium]